MSPAPITKPLNPVGAVERSAPRLIAARPQAPSRPLGRVAMSEHVWAQENIAAYVAGGLDASEGERIEKHAADCAACARDIDDARSLERKLAPLVLAADPGPALEDRIIQSLPTVRANTR